jgi:hypothetical protein
VRSACFKIKQQELDIQKVADILSYDPNNIAGVLRATMKSHSKNKIKEIIKQEDKDCEVI